MSNRMHVMDNDSHDINVASQELQRKVLDEVNKSVSTNSSTFGTERLTMGVSIAGSNQACRECFITTQSTADVHIAIKNSGNATVLDFLLPPDIVLPLPVRNTSQIRVYCATAGEYVYLMWRN